MREKTKNKGAVISARDIDAIYALYPRKVAPKYAKKCILRALMELTSRDLTDPVAWLSERVSKFAASHAGNNGAYTPHPSTWFNQGRYDDDPAEWDREDEPKKVAGSKALKAWGASNG